MTAFREALINPRFLPEQSRDLISESERLMLGLIFKCGTLTQAELTAELPLSQQSISRMTTALESRGMLKRGARRSNGRRGQPSGEVGLDPDFAYSIGLSLRADSLSGTIVDFAGNARASSSVQPEQMSRVAVLDCARSLLSELTKTASVDSAKIFGVGLATTGFRVKQNAQFNPPPSLEDFALIDLEAVFAQALNLPVWAENDGKAATLAEIMNGVGRNCSDFAYFYIATGVGGGFAMDGKLVTGKHGNAGEFVGILPIDDYAFPNLQLLRNMLVEDGIHFANVNELVRNYDEEWPAIGRWIQKVSPSLSLMASATAAILDTELIVLGGMIPRDLAQRLIPEIGFFDINRRAVRRPRAQIVYKECHGDATSTGAALLPLSHKFFTYC